MKFETIFKTILNESKIDRINKFSNLTDEQKEEVKEFYRQNTNGYNDFIDWQRPDKVTYDDFLKVKQAKENSKSNKKSKVIAKNVDYTTLFDRNDIYIHGEDNKYIYVSPLSYEACKWINSYECGFGTAQWCIGYQTDPKHYREYMEQGFAFVLAFRKDFKTLDSESKNVYMKYMIQYNPFIEDLTLEDDCLLRAGAVYRQEDDRDYADDHSIAVLNKINKDSVVIDEENYSIDVNLLKQYCKKYWEIMTKHNLPFNNASYYTKERTHDLEPYYNETDEYKEKGISLLTDKIITTYGIDTYNLLKDEIPYKCKYIHKPDFIWDILVDYYDNNLKDVILHCLTKKEIEITEDIINKVVENKTNVIFDTVCKKIENSKKSIFIRDNIIKGLILNYGDSVEIEYNPSTIELSLNINSEEYLTGANGYGIVINYKDYEKYKDKILISDIYLSGTLGNYTLDNSNIQGICNSTCKHLSIPFSNKSYYIIESYIEHLETESDVVIINCTIENSDFRCKNYKEYNSNIN